MQKQQRTHNFKHWIEVPIELEVRSKSKPSEVKVEKSTITLPMPQSHIQKLELAAKLQDISYEQATLDVVQLHLESIQRQFIETLTEKEQREMIVTITVRGGVTWIRKK